MLDKKFIENRIKEKMASMGYDFKDIRRNQTKLIIQEIYWKYCERVAQYANFIM